MTEPSTTIEAVADTTAQVREHLSSFEDVTLDDDGSATLLWGSARVDVSVEVFDQDQSVVRVNACCVTGATPSPELYEHVATASFDLGHFEVVPSGDGAVDILIRHS